MLDPQTFFETINKSVEAPFRDYDEETRTLLTRLGVIDENDAPDEATISILARAAAVCLYEAYRLMLDAEDFDVLEAVHNALRSLLGKGEPRGMYFYLAHCFSATPHDMPFELEWLACREDLLTLYLKRFITECETIMAEYSANN